MVNVLGVADLQGASRTNPYTCPRGQELCQFPDTQPCLHWQLRQSFLRMNINIIPINFKDCLRITVEITTADLIFPFRFRGHCCIAGPLLRAVRQLPNCAIEKIDLL